MSTRESKKRLAYCGPGLPGRIDVGLKSVSLIIKAHEGDGADQLPRITPSLRVCFNNLAFV